MTRPKLSDEVVAQLQRQILAGAYVPGDRLPTEAELCEAFGVSRSVIRDALRTLSSAGLVSVVHGHGITVAEPSDTGVTTAIALLLARSGITIGDVVAARAMLETAIAMEAAERGTPEDWDRLEADLEAFRHAAEAEDLPEAERLHRRFHLRILDAVHLPALELLLRPMQELIATTSVPPSLQDKGWWEPDSHDPIVAALRGGKRKAARAAMTEHFAYIHRDEYAEFRETPFHAAGTLEAYWAIFGLDFASSRS